ncbi:MAG TPA: DUF192 domain-containing protein [Candidatus Nanoarchaeia archaeon]|nr:DUF192 domain-containing protein [Candidatus Nanoarchaeia archaeon]
MKIVNDKIVIAGNVKFCDNVFSKAKGLMFSRRLKKGCALVLVNDGESVLETAIHMLFVFFAIDVVWLDSGLKVVDKRENIRAFTPFIAPREPAKYVLELPLNTARHINKGDILEFIDR